MPRRAAQRPTAAAVSVATALYRPPTPELASPPRTPTSPQGNPLFFSSTVGFDVDALLAAATLDQVVEAYVKQFELFRARIAPALSVLQQRQVTKYTSVMDLSGLRRQHFSSASRTLLRRTSTISEVHYPESMGRMVVVNAPPVFALAWALLRPLLNDSTRRAVSVHRDDGRAEILRLVRGDASMVPRSLFPDWGESERTVGETWGAWLRVLGEGWGERAMRGQAGGAEGAVAAWLTEHSVARAARGETATVVDRPDAVEVEEASSFSEDETAAAPSQSDTQSDQRRTWAAWWAETGSAAALMTPSSVTPFFERGVAWLGWSDAGSGATRSAWRAGGEDADMVTSRLGTRREQRRSTPGAHLSCSEPCEADNAAVNEAPDDEATGRPHADDTSSEGPLMRHAASTGALNRLFAKTWDRAKPRRGRR